jgi:hypothetical protein
MIILKKKLLDLYYVIEDIIGRKVKTKTLKLSLFYESKRMIKHSAQS